MPTRTRGKPANFCTVLLVDDQPEFLGLGEQLLSSHPSIRVVGKAISGEEALALMPILQPGVVILDVNMPGMNGFEAARQVRKNCPDAHVVMMSGVDDPDYRTLAQVVGAVAFLNKRQLSAEAVLNALQLQS